MNALSLTPEQLATLRHMLGITDRFAASPKPYRNYYCANPGDAELRALQNAGAVELYSERGGCEWYRCTPAGEHAALGSWKAVRASRGARTYQRFLSVKDAIPGLTFGEFLTGSAWREYRIG